MPGSGLPSMGTPEAAPETGGAQFFASGCRWERVLLPPPIIRALAGDVRFSQNLRVWGPITGRNDS